jgi:hypothetical protein
MAKTANEYSPGDGGSKKQKPRVARAPWRGLLFETD